MLEPRLLSIKDGAVYLGYPSEGALRMAMSRGIIPAEAIVALDGRVKLDRRQLDQLINRRRGIRQPQPVHLRKQK